MKRITKKIFTLLLIFTMIFSLGKWEIFASEISDAQNKKNSLEKKKEETENMLASLEKKKNNILEYVKELDKQLSSIEQSIDDLNDKIAVTEINLSKTKEELKEAQAEEKNQYEAMKTRIQYMYVNGNTEYIQIVFSSDSIADFLNRSEYVKQISSYDKNMLERFQKVKEQVEEKKKNIEKDLESLNEMNEELAYKKSTVQKLMKDKKAEVDKYNKNINKSQAAVEAYAKAIKEQEDEIERLFEEQRRKIATQEGNSYSTSTVSKNGYVWPAPSSRRITCGFGPRKAPTAGASTYHKGIDIGVPTGSAIVATKAGTVCISSYSSSAGYYIMINHGNGVMSYYMHNSRLLVNVGEKVSAGQTIALSGSTGISTGPHLHFAISVNGNYVNPREFVG